MPKRVMVAWSGGKDSAWALHVLRRCSDVEIAGLFTTVNEDTDRVAVHEVPGALLREQARAADAALQTIPIPRPCPNAAYERAIAQFVAGAKSAGVTHLAFGDLFLEDIRRYRERQFAGSGVELLFPLWGLPTRALAEEMTACGLRAWIVCVDSTRAPRDWAGKVFDPAFVAAVPEGIDPCGENGEFHTFVFEGPMLRRPVRATPGAIVGSGQQVCVDLLT
ncbi:MAG TPA: ATP-binding protein [Burkholderiales bacterium]|nr:ATP-binding protein [Burkholderiales bacterium]